jgi:GntR family transcriptional regulator
MITLDRNAPIPILEQLVARLRYLIASGHYQIDEVLPSTRMLADQLDLSFHTVRKAYQALEAEGLLASKVGSGFRVKERAPLSKAERIERGAAVMQEALQQLVGLGMAEDEVEYTFQEQFSLLEDPPERSLLLFVAPYREMALLGAEQITLALQQPVEAVTLDRLAYYREADYAFTPCPQLRQVMAQLPHADVYGTTGYLTPETLDRIARLLEHETLGLLTRHADTIAPLSEAIQTFTGFTGPILAASIDEGVQHLPALLKQMALVVFTPSCRRRVQHLLPEGLPHLPIAPTLSPESIAFLRQVIPR